MERLQVLEREFTRWSPRYEVQVGFQENWVLDKTTDTARDLVIWVDDAERPNWKVMDWVRLLHIPDGQPDAAATYDAEGKPINNNQYLIGDIQFETRPVSGWKVYFSLIEPIERFRGVLGETLSYTNKPGVRDYNHYSALERWLKLTPANCDTYLTGYNKNNNRSWWNRIKISAGDAEALSLRPFYNQTLNELSLYDLLFDIYDPSLKRTPVAYFDLNGDVPRNWARDEYVLAFERQDGFDKPELELSALKEGGAKMIVSQNLSNYATGLMSNVENLITGKGLEYPAKSIYAVPEYDSINRDLASKTNDKDDNWIIRLPFPVMKITKVMRLKMAYKELYVSQTSTWYEYFMRSASDITNNVYEKKEYSLLHPFDNTSMWYEEGSDKLHLRDYKYDNEGEVLPGINDRFITAWLYYIEYQAVVNPRVAIGNSEFVQQVNQAYSQIDSPNFGAFLNGYLNGMNKADIIIQKTYNAGMDSYAAYNGFKDLIGSRVNDGAKTYRITAVSYRNRNFQYDAIIQLNENYFRKSSNYQASQAIRANTGIPLDNIKDRKTVIKQTVKLSRYSLNGGGYSFLTDKRALLSALSAGNIPSDIVYPQIAVLRLHYNVDVRYMIIDIAAFTLGTQVNFNLQFIDNALAGMKKEYLSYKGGNGYNLFPRVEKQTPILFTDANGEVESADIWLGKVDFNLGDYTESHNFVPSPPNGEYPPAERIDAALASRRTYDILGNMPAVIGDYANDIVAGAVVEVEGLQVKKDALERFNLNIAIEMQSDDLIIFNDIAELSRLVYPAGTERFSATFPIRIHFFNKNVSEDEVIGTGHEVARVATVAYESNAIKYEYTSFTNSIKSAIISANVEVDNSYVPVNKKLIIMNNIDKDAALLASIKAGALKIYFN